MARFFGYLRVSRETQDVESQKLGLLEYANRSGFAPVELTVETIGRDSNWKTRALAPLVDSLLCGDVLLVPEFTRLGSTPAQVFAILEAVSSKGAIVHITKTNTVMDGSLQSQLLASVFAMASLVELEFIRARTTEGLQRARAAGKTLGRPKGSKSTSKLAGRAEEIKNYLAIGLSKRKIAKQLGVSFNTLQRYLRI